MVNSEKIEPYIEEFPQIYLWEVIHNIPGRVRLRLAWLREYPSKHSSLINALTHLTFITDVYLSSINNSIVVYYDHQQISLEDLKAELLEIFLLMTPKNWIKEQANQLKDINQETIGFDVEFLTKTWEENKQGILMGVGTTCLAVGGILVPIPLVPGWPLLLLGGYCLKLASENPS
ncbi:hypothetical protein PCC7424_0229 [Gloeothece citriformis PCC 7424]|uniref:Uncharacterized protein n=1 Tax=Gloeothece citriformis (strain PCC 7424) TaxID=65393 RepID=B7KAM5_GLOC7|nr:hypothetical protein [Gloeothece citriformis]ACK68697.1 hypothetical protein PCC7424_0229 [Gloeothece citriformis PCC 7424]